MQSNVMMLSGNHFKFELKDLPELTFFAQAIVLPDVSAAIVERRTPFTTIKEVADHLDFGTLQVTYALDAEFKTYFSLWKWLRGYGFPTSYDELKTFATDRRKQVPNARPMLREIQKTAADCHILRPDTDSPVATIHFTDVIPVSLGQLSLDPTVAEPVPLTTQAAFEFTDFEVSLVS